MCWCSHRSLSLVLGVFVFSILFVFFPTILYYEGVYYLDSCAVGIARRIAPKRSKRASSPPLCSPGVAATLCLRRKDVGICAWMRGHRRKKLDSSYARLETSKRWMVACDILMAAWTQHHPARSRFCARRRAVCSLTRRLAKPRLKPRRRPRSELPLHRLRPGRMLVRAPDLTSSWPGRKAEPRPHQRGSNPRRTRGGRRALRAAPRSAAPSSWAVAARTAVPSIEPCPRGAWPLT